MFHHLWWFYGDYNSLSVTFHATLSATWVTSGFRHFSSVEDEVLAQWPNLLLFGLLSVLHALCPSLFHLLSPHMLSLFPKLHFTLQFGLTCAGAWVLPARAQGHWRNFLRVFALCSLSSDFSSQIESTLANGDKVTNNCSLFPSSRSSCLFFLHSPLIFLLQPWGFLLALYSRFFSPMRNLAFPDIGCLYSSHSFLSWSGPLLQILLREKAVFVSLHDLS